MIERALQELKGRVSLVHVEVIPARQAVYGTLQRALPAELEKYISSRKLRLYSHQFETINLLRSGKNVVLTTPTASGKTLAFSLPIMEALLADSGARALFLYPTKALANDQLKFLEGLDRFAHAHALPRVYDGDTPAGKRPAIRDRSRIIISNLHELHQVLPWHYKWEKFFRGLKYIVIDEAHRYRGVPGAGAAFLMRRLTRVCRHYGANPLFVLSTATLANPAEFAAKLTGVDCEHVGRSGAPAGRRYFLIVNPFNDKGGSATAPGESRELFVHFLKSGLQAICFTSSRKMAELISVWSRADLEKAAPELAGKVAAYRAGYLPEERRKLENELKSGQLRGVISTNALELGIDIGSLDAVILCGYPGTAIATWQQAGRAGRGTGDSLAALVAFEDALDQYFARNPETFFSRPPEQAVIDLANPHIRAGHLICAAAEIPIVPDKDEGLLGTGITEALDSLGRHGLVARTPRGWVYCGKARPADIVSLDGIASDVFTLSCEGRTIGTMDRRQAFREAHEGAVLVHQGETYLVEQLDLESKTAFARKTNVDHYTVPLKETTLRVTGGVRHGRVKGAEVCVGNLNVTERFKGFKVIRREKTLGVRELSLPPLEFNTVGVWFTVEEETGEQIRRAGLDFWGGLHGVEHAMIAGVPFHLLCDRWDMGGLSAAFHEDTLKPAIFLYDGYEGGVGIAERIFADFEKVLSFTLKLVAACGCESGCPACIYSPKCGNENRPLDKAAALEILKRLNDPG